MARKIYIKRQYDNIGKPRKSKFLEFLYWLTLCALVLFCYKQVVATPFEHKLIPEEQTSQEPHHVSDVKFTFYLPKQGNKDGLTALGTKATPGRTVAVSRDLAEQGWLGRTVYIPGFGVRLVEDLMDESIKGNRADICMASRSDYPDNFTGYMTVIDNARKLDPVK